MLYLLCCTYYSLPEMASTSWKEQQMFSNNDQVFQTTVYFPLA